MYDTEEFQDEIVDKISRAQRFMELIIAKPPRRSPIPTRNTSQSDPSQPQLESTPEQSNIVESGPVNVSVVESELGSVSITDAARLVSSITSTDNTPLAITSSTISSHVTTSNVADTCIPQHMSSTSTTAMAHRMNMGPSPLIPTAPSSAHSLISPQRPITSTLLTPQNLYELPMNPQGLVSTSTVSAPRSMYEPFAAPVHNLTSPMHPAATSHQSQMFITSRLPKLTLSTFSGDPLHWKTFWDSFYVAIHANPNLCGIHKFSYLKAQLQGDAARTIAGLPLTDLNYNHAISILEDRYA